MLIHFKNNNKSFDFLSFRIRYRTFFYADLILNIFFQASSCFLHIYKLNKFSRCKGTSFELIKFFFVERPNLKGKKIL